MPRRNRGYVPGIGAHVVQRGNNRQNCYRCQQDFATYAKYMIEYAIELDIKVHAWVLMTNHIHMYCTGSEKYSLSKFMQRLSSRYARYFNRRYQRTGTLWEGRFYSAMVEDELHSLNVHRYIELNPVNAYMVKRPADYHWSSYGTNALGVESSVCSPHRDYLALGATEEERRRAYRHLFLDKCSQEFIDEIRAATASNGALGSAEFKQKLFEKTGIRYAPQRGGPKEGVVRME